MSGKTTVSFTIIIIYIDTHAHTHLPWFIGFQYTHISFNCSYIPWDMYITLIFNECFAQQNQCFQIIVLFYLFSQPTLVSLFFLFCKQYSFSNDYFSLHYFICTTRVNFMKLLISTLFVKNLAIFFHFI
jgi:hypothetical protein